MKNFVQTVIMTLVLAALVSLLDYRPAETAYGGGSGMKYKGDSGLIVPGGGELVTEVNYTPMQAEKQENEPPEKTEAVERTNEESTEVPTTVSKMESEEITEEHKEEHKKVDMLVISFWHGVAAVLVGGASALLVAFVWMKIRGGKDA